MPEGDSGVAGYRAPASLGRLPPVNVVGFCRNISRIGGLSDVNA